MNAESDREQLLNLIVKNSFRLGNFTLSSGLKSDYYIDCRTTTLHAQGAELTARVFLELFRQQRWYPQAIGGLTLGADPIVTAVAVISGQQGIPVHGFLVRKVEKTHGAGQRVEGFQQKEARVVIVDDVCTTGSSTVQAIEAARESGFTVIAAACLVEREEAGGRRWVEQAAAPAPFFSVFRSSEIKAAHLNLGSLAHPVIGSSKKPDL